MIDPVQIRLTLRAPLLAAAVVPASDVAWEGRPFDPAGKSMWIRETLLPVGEEHMAQNTPEFAGIMVYDVFAPSAGGTETIETAVGELGDAYSPDDAPLEGTGVRVVVISVSRLNLLQDGPWRFIPVHVEFRAFDS